jgi:hypothetical protein
MPVVASHDATGENGAAWGIDDLRHADQVRHPLDPFDAVGCQHITRPEDWPVMPAERAGFMLKPAGFFDRNPALDVAPSPSGHC